MADTNSGRPPAEAFYTVTDPEQARPLSNAQTFEFFRPFAARERTATEAAEELGVNLDTMLYRIKTFLNVGLLHVSRLEKRAGRPIKYYRSVHDAYFIPFDVTPFADTEERLRYYFDKRSALIAPKMAAFLRQSGREGRRIYRNLNNDEVWSESAAEAVSDFNLYDAESYRNYMASYRGLPAEFMDDMLKLTDADARALLADIYEVWRRYKHKESDSNRAYIFQFALVPETS